MPFTFAHPAIVIPLIRQKRIKFSASGLIIGSLAPDFESFLKLGGEKIYGHTWLGIIWFDMPLAFALAIVFHTLIKLPLTDNLPQVLQTRFLHWRNQSFLVNTRANLPLVLSSLFVGILSHLLLDAFTHLNIVYPDAITSRIMIGNRRVYIVLQYFTSLAGLVYIATQVGKLPKQQATHTLYRSVYYWPLFIFFSAIIATPLIWYNVDFTGWVDKVYIINILISSSVFSILLVSAVVLLSTSARKVN